MPEMKILNSSGFHAWRAGLFAPTSRAERVRVLIAAGTTRWRVLSVALIGLDAVLMLSASVL